MKKDKIKRDESDFALMQFWADNGRVRPTVAE